MPSEWPTPLRRTVSTLHQIERGWAFGILLVRSTGYHYRTTSFLGNWIWHGLKSGQSQAGALYFLDREWLYSRSPSYHDLYSTRGAEHPQIGRIMGNWMNPTPSNVAYTYPPRTYRKRASRWTLYESVVEPSWLYQWSASQFLEFPPVYL